LVATKGLEKENSGMQHQVYRNVFLTGSMFLIAIQPGLAQTALDLRTQSKNVDFSNAVGTKPFQTGVAMPSLCEVGQMFFLTTAASGSNLYGCTAANVWVLQSGGGAGFASQLGDFRVIPSSATVLTIGPDCSTSTPCNIRYGAQVFSFVTGATVTLSAGTGSALVYISSAGVLTVGHGLTVSCSGCTAQSGVTTFPADCIPLFIWTATSGTWNSSGGTDLRAFLSSELVAAGVGIQVIQTSGQNIVTADTTVVGLRVSVPPSSSSACVAGSWAASSSFYYICASTNTWVRTALSSF
jgi:hypothetical protein